jgi:hypothetical protein
MNLLIPPETAKHHPQKIPPLTPSQFLQITLTYYTVKSYSDQPPAQTGRAVTIHQRALWDVADVQADGVAARVHRRVAGITDRAARAVVLKTDSSLWLCGDNSYGQPGHNLSLSQNVFMLLGCPFSTVGISETAANAIAEVVPNPASDVISLKGFAADEAVAIYSAQGQLVISCVGGYTISISELPAGLYVIRSQNKTVRFIKR